MTVIVVHVVWQLMYSSYPKLFETYTSNKFFSSEYTGFFRIHTVNVLYKSMELYRGSTQKINYYKLEFISKDGKAIFGRDQEVQPFSCTDRILISESVLYWQKKRAEVSPVG